MFHSSLWKKVCLYGIVSGIVLALFFKIVEQMTGDKVYTLLLNVDYIPFINQYQFPEIIEVLFHLIVSILLAFFLLVFMMYKHISSPKYIVVWSVFICLVIGIVLYPTTAFSIRTPPLLSMSAIFYWLTGHVLYGVILGWFLRNR